MSRNGSTVRGDPTEDTGSPVRGQDDQGREEMSASLNSEAGPGVGVQSTSARQTLSPDRKVDVGRKASLRICARKRRLTL